MLDQWDNFMNDNKSDFVQRLRAIIDTSVDGIITIDNKGTVETMNPAAATLFGYHPEEVIGSNIKMLMPEPYHSEHDGYLHRYRKTRKPHIIGTGREVSGLTKQGQVFPMRLAVSEVILNDRVIYTGVIHDLSDVKKAQREIVLLNKQLEEKVAERTYKLEEVVNKLLTTNTSLTHEITERKEIEQKLKENEEVLKDALEKEKELNELKSRFVSMASHEFRTPLTTVLSSASLISRYPREDQQPNREKHVNRIKSAVANLTGILNDFLSLSKLEEGRINVNLQMIDLAALCPEVIAEVKGLLKTEQQIIHTFTGEGTTMVTDVRILKNILFNLISNAIKYSDESIHCSFDIGPERVIMSVTDTGIGIPEEDQKHLFTRFFRAGNVTNIQGTGLGLNIVRRYADLLEGTIEFESEHEVGTTFTLTLPVHKS